LNTNDKLFKTRFKQGDIVIAVESADISGCKIKIGEILTIVGHNPDASLELVILKEKQAHFSASRFAIAKDLTKLEKAIYGVLDES
jgi:hypothetical protein